MKEVLEKIKNMSSNERRNLDYQELVNIINTLTPDEIIELSNIIGYPVFTRLCMGELKHKFVLLQDGAAAIIVNSNGQILMQRRADKDIWGLPGGCQELGERFEDTIIREVKEETNLDVINTKYLNINYKYISRKGIECHEFVFMSLVKDGNIILNEENIGYNWLNIDEYIKEIYWYRDKEELRKILTNYLKGV